MKQPSKMKAEIYKIKRGHWKVDIVHKHQSFELAYEGNKKECQWMAKCFNDLLKKLNIN